MTLALCTAVLLQRGAKNQQSGTVAAVSINDNDETSGPIIQLSRVRKSYGDNDALRDVSFGIMRGELAFLVGPSGAGKSTVLKLLTRELIADEGQVVVAGRELSSMAVRHIPQLRRAIAYVPQDYPLLPGRNLEENVKFALSVLGWPRARAGERCDEVLELVGLSDKRGSNAEELSGGERQRAAIARAVACAPKILLADEPTGNLDPGTTAGVMRVLDTIAKNGTTVLVSTHDRTVVDALRRRVIELDAGVCVRSELLGTYRSSQ